MAYNRTDAQKAVETAAALLDEKGPERWWDLIDLEILDMRKGEKCVLGQLYKNASEFGNGYTYARYGILSSSINAINAGEAFAGFNTEWKEFIIARRNDPTFAPATILTLESLRTALAAGKSLEDVVNELDPPKPITVTFDREAARAVRDLIGNRFRVEDGDLDRALNALDLAFVEEKSQ
jgi:hypothetical protein